MFSLPEWDDTNNGISLFLIENVLKKKAHES